MTTKRRNEKTRLLLTLELAVILPAAALVILSAWHVLHIQRDRAVEAAIQRDFSQVLVISEKQINHKAYELVDDVRTELPAPSEACAGRRWTRFWPRIPYAAHIFVYSPETGMVFRSQSDRLEGRQAFRDEADYLNKMFDGWLKMDFDDLTEKLATDPEERDRPISLRGNGCRVVTRMSISRPHCLSSRTRRPESSRDRGRGPRRRVLEGPVFPRDAG